MRPQAEICLHGNELAARHQPDKAGERRFDSGLSLPEKTVAAGLHVLEV